MTFVSEEKSNTRDGFKCDNQKLVAVIYRISNALEEVENVTQSSSVLGH